MMQFLRFTHLRAAILAGFAMLGLAGAAAQAAPLPPVAAAQSLPVQPSGNGQIDQGLLTQVQWGPGYRRGYGRPYYGRPRYYARPRYYGRPYYARPAYRCRVVYRRVYDPYRGRYVSRAVRRC